jgi:hypothetical protein
MLFSFGNAIIGSVCRGPATAGSFLYKIVEIRTFNVIVLQHVAGFPVTQQPQKRRYINHVPHELTVRSPGWTRRVR